MQFWGGRSEELFRSSSFLLHSEWQCSRLSENGSASLVLYHKIYNPYDFDNYQIPGLKRFSTRYDVVIPLVGALSDNGTPGYKESIL